MSDGNNGRGHDIFVTDPMKLAEFTGKTTKIRLSTGDELTGVVYTVDPVSQCVVLTSKSDGSEKTTVRIVMRDSVKSMEIVAEGDEQVPIFDALQGNQVTAGARSEKEKVKNWLSRNLIPIVEADDVLRIDSLEIHPPYGPDQCLSSNSIVLSRIQTLLKQMPLDGS